MKRFFLMWWLVIALLLSGCGSSASRVETLKSWSFQYNEGTSDYSLFFALADKNDKPLSADVDVDIRIVNDEDEEVYTGTKSVSTDDFGYYTSQAAGEQYLANVRIPAAEIRAGTSASGKVYFTVYKENAVQFDEVNCDALYCLPIEDVQVTFDSFPLDLKVKNFIGSTASVIQIQGAEFKLDKDYSPQLTITITGEKKSGSSDSGYDVISYKLYDSAGYLVDSGNIYLSSLRDKTYYTELPHIPRICEGYGVFFCFDTSKIPIKSPLWLMLLWLSPLSFYPRVPPIYSYVGVTSVTDRR